MLSLTSCPLRCAARSSAARSSAQSALGALPYGNVELEQTATFLARTGDYAMALSRTPSVHGLTEEHRAALSDLSGQAAALSQTLQSLESDLYAGTVQLEDLDAVRERLSRAAEDGTQTTAGSSFQTIESECSELPTLVYDGPFSDHIAGRTPRMLEGAVEVSRMRPEPGRQGYSASRRNSLICTQRGQAGFRPTASPPRRQGESS